MENDFLEVPLRDKLAGYGTSLFVVLQATDDAVGRYSTGVALFVERVLAETWGTISWRFEKWCRYLIGWFLALFFAK